MHNQSFQLMLDGVPFEVKAVPFSFNEGTRFNVTVNNSDEYVFAYDSNVSQFVAIDDDGATLPQNVETEISGKLISMPVS